MTLSWLGERFGSGDGEREALLTRQIAFEPLPASVLFAFLVVAEGRAHESVVCPPEPPRAKEVCIVIWASSALRRSLACRGIDESTAIINSTTSGSDHLHASLIWAACGADEVQTDNLLRMPVVGRPIGCQLLNRETPKEWLAGNKANPPKRLSPNDQKANQCHKWAKRPISDGVLNGRGRCPPKPAGP